MLNKSERKKIEKEATYKIGMVMGKIYKLIDAYEVEIEELQKENKQLREEIAEQKSLGDKNI